ncbi:MAG: hypothetical protein AAGF83_27375 [Cyanobacteria bacterium P01_G01_bin.67]
MQDNESNTAKSSGGHSFNQQLNKLMSQLLTENKIDNFRKEPRYNYPSKKQKQFSPDGEITLLDGRIIIYDNTTTVRHDRLKQKLWDAYGIKEHFKSQDILIQYYVVVPDEMIEKEVKNFLREKAKLNNSEYYSTIDDIITIRELLKIIVN